MRTCLFLTALFLPSVFAQNAVSLRVDATDAPRRLFHVRMSLPAKPGPMALLYPEWIPGEHGPTGPIANLVGLKIQGAGKVLPWKRDAVNMFKFHVDVPAGVSTLDVVFDFITPPDSEGFSSGGSATSELAVLNWNQLLLYPEGTKPDDFQYQANLKVPNGWRYGTALPIRRESGNEIEFQPAPLTTLIDSPVSTGAHYRTIDLGSDMGAPHYLHLAADSDRALEVSPEVIGQYKNLVKETGALFGSRHYRGYHFLYTLSDHVAHFGLEHHESSDDRVGERCLIDPDLFKLEAGLLPHEMTHSWNGKYRRPAGLDTLDYQQPMKDELLWVYEGLTEYLGEILAARCGLWHNEDFREWLALQAAKLDSQPGRTWRPLIDTTIAAQLLYDARKEGSPWRRGVDFYPEGALIWLEADVLIRQHTQGRRSLDDFCKRFCGGTSGPPKVVPYTREDVVALLNEVAPDDWQQFFQARVYDITPRAPLGGIEGAGWRLVYSNAVPPLLKAAEGDEKYTDLRFSLGLSLKEGGEVEYVVPGSPAAKAGVSGGMKLVAVNTRRWTPEILRAAVSAAETNAAPIELLVENADYFKSCKVDYHEGERYPWLERNPAKPDLLTEILKPLTPAP